MVLEQIANLSLGVIRVLSSSLSRSANFCSHSTVVVHVLGKDETQVQFLLRAPQKCGIMDSSGVRSMDRTAFF